MHLELQARKVEIEINNDGVFEIIAKVFMKDNIDYSCVYETLSIMISMDDKLIVTNSVIQFMSSSEFMGVPIHRVTIMGQRMFIMPTALCDNVLALIDMGKKK